MIRRILWLSLLLAVGNICAQTPVPGVTRPILDETLSFVIAGKITKVHVKEGDRVSPGDILIELDRRSQELEASRRKLLMTNKTQLNAALARVEMLAATLKSTQELYDRTKSVSKDELAALVLEHRLAVGEVDSYKLQEEREVIEHEMAVHEISLRTLASPISGIVTDVMRHKGETFQPHQPLLQIVDISKCFFVAHVDPRLSIGLKKGQKLPLLFEMGVKKLELSGDIVYIAPTADPASGLLEVRISFTNPDERIPAGVDGIVTIPQAQ